MGMGHFPVDPRLGRQGERRIGCGIAAFAICWLAGNALLWGGVLYLIYFATIRFSSH